MKYPNFLLLTLIAVCCCVEPVTAGRRWTTPATAFQARRGRKHTIQAGTSSNKPVPVVAEEMASDNEKNVHEEIALRTARETSSSDTFILGDGGGCFGFF